jgi:hypothetical protein
MKKKMFLSLAFLITSVSSWSAAFDQPVREIKCTITPIDRAKIHPNGDYATTQSTSTNWSGYVAATDFEGSTANGSVTCAAGNWVVPVLKATTDNTYCAIWIGLDGYEWYS